MCAGYSRSMHGIAEFDPRGTAVSIPTKCNVSSSMVTALELNVGHAVYPFWILFLGEGVEGRKLGLGKVHMRRATSQHVQWSSRLLHGVCVHAACEGGRRQRAKNKTKQPIK